MMKEKFNSERDSKPAFSEDRRQIIEAIDEARRELTNIIQAQRACLKNYIFTCQSKKQIS